MSKPPNLSAVASAKADKLGGLGVIEGQIPLNMFEFCNLKSKEFVLGRIKAVFQGKVKTHENVSVHY